MCVPKEEMHDIYYIEDLRAAAAASLYYLISSYIISCNLISITLARAARGRILANVHTIPAVIIFHVVVSSTEDVDY